MPIYDGIVTVAEDDIPVIIELGDDVVRLSASGTEIGQWPKGECDIRHLGDSTFAIRAENETLRFVPRQPSLFAAAVNGGLSRTRPQTSPGPEKPQPEPTDRVREAPPPKPVTMGLFYGLCALTAGLAIWSIISMIF